MIESNLNSKQIFTDFHFFFHFFKNAEKFVTTINLIETHKKFTDYTDMSTYYENFTMCHRIADNITPMLKEQLRDLEENSMPRSILCVAMARDALKKGIGNETTLKGREALFCHNILTRQSLKMIILLREDPDGNPNQQAVDRLKEYLKISNSIQENNHVIIEGLEEEVKLSILEEHEYLEICKLIQETYDCMKQFIGLLAIPQKLAEWEAYQRRSV